MYIFLQIYNFIISGFKVREINIGIYIVRLSAPKKKVEEEHLQTLLVSSESLCCRH